MTWRQKVKRSVVMWVMLGLFSLAWAQLDPKAAPFLDSLGDLDNNQALQDAAELKTLDYTMCFTSYDKGKAQPETCIRSAIDYVKRRIAVRTTIREDESFNTDMVYEDGHIRMTDFLTGKPAALPEAQAKPLAEMLEKTFDQILQGNFMPDQFESTHYDGPVSYGKVIQGEQVSATLKLPSFDPESSAPEKTTVRLIFGKDKALLGTITPTDEGNLLSVLTEPSANMIEKFMNTTSYMLEGNQPVLTLKNRVTQFRLNKPLDEKLFTLEPKELPSRKLPRALYDP